MNLISLLSESLLHFLWQGTAVAIVLGLFLNLSPQASPSARYLASGLALLLMVILPVATFLSLAGSQTKGRTLDASAAIVPSSAIDLSSPAPSSVIPHEPSRAPAIESSYFHPVWQQLVVGSWLLGATLLSLRLAMNWVRTVRLKRGGTPVTDGAIREDFESLCASIGVSSSICILASTRYRVPMVVGCWHPVILLPASILSGMPAEYLRAILSHELAHIRRYDYLINLFQHLVEALLFFHPAVWWASHQLRRERELCCDDRAAHSHGVLTYCEALLSLERQLGSKVPPQFAPAANDGRLLTRIKRLARQDADYRSSAPAALLALVIPLVLLGFALLPTKAERIPSDFTEPAKDGRSQPTEPAINLNSPGADEFDQIVMEVGDYPHGLTYTYDIGDGQYLSPSGHRLSPGRGFFGDVSNVMLTLQGAKNMQLPIDTVFSTEGEFRSVGGDDGPIFSRQFLGGADNLRGYDFREAARATRVSAEQEEAGPRAPAVHDPVAPQARRTPLQSVDIRDRIVALTFIAGPHPHHTPAILDLLKRQGAKATFFVVGKNARRHPKLLQRMVAEGHEIGNNTMSHANFKKLPEERLLDEIRSCQEVVKEAARVTPSYLRPPYGQITGEQQKLIQLELKVVPVLWSIDSQDWLRHEPKVTAERVVKAVRPGGIILFHDIHKPTVEATRLTIEGLRKSGYRFATVAGLDALQKGERE